MSLALTARTEPGERLVALAETLAAEIAPHAAAHDRDGSYPHAGADRLAAAGYYAAPIPEHLGGMGASCLHDVVVGNSRLARADASLAIGVNMHMAALLNMVRMYERGAEKLAPALERIARDGVRMSAAVSEPGQDLTRPGTVATRTPDGWRIDGRKLFCTGSPAATVLYTSVSFAGEDGGERYGYAMVPADAAGVTVHGDWDALGMRASGSHSVTFDAVALPAAALRGGFPVGDADGYMSRNLNAGLFHAAASLGIAEAAQDQALQAARRSDDARSRALVAESAMDLSAARGALSRAAQLVDERREDIAALFAEAQAAKTFTNDAACRVVDRALTLTGGAGYRSGHPLARAYRDVRAGAFMHPLGANRAYDLVGRVALGADPAIH
ncbi:acyl-CoA dehydrogenase family protein [Solirubrobacter ginsenosidimutans]|uniref:Acyl-CoA dehydrogenase family protein n=1 Tax=Solirubrobacter ginsenosidimutans TaxID=490573 RepID=A0A9X3MYT7_9ACTN|nr:acyl-CoA dehydrogenase family protein [Solirubrobacter ginsenosidimutans]MDA0161963.1 acyl-CoA dehydrogenase family protein [Solirubrobacter ginsenosidimutans]